MQRITKICDVCEEEQPQEDVYWECEHRNVALSVIKVDGVNPDLNDLDLCHDCRKELLRAIVDTLYTRAKDTSTFKNVACRSYEAKDILHWRD